MFKQILIVCIGNICRSPVAEKLLRQKLSRHGIAVSSAGLGAVNGSQMDETAIEVLRAHGVDDTAHVARQLDEPMIHTADLLLVMEKDHLRAIGRRAPQARGKTFLLGRWLDDLEIPDPYRQPRMAFEHAYAQIERATEHWRVRLQSTQGGL